MRARNRLLAVTVWIAAAVANGARSGEEPPGTEPIPAILGSASHRGTQAAPVAPGDPENLIREGRILLAELRCVVCHPVDAATTAWLETPAAPRLEDVGTRLDPHFLAQFIADPARLHPGTTMPAVLVERSETERTRAANDLVHFLLTASRRDFRRTAPDLAAARSGEKLYHEVGCVACHPPRQDGAPDLATSSRPFPPLEAKWSFDGLRRFLRDPLSLRPSGRMPSLALSDGEASDIAHYLLVDTRVDGGLAYEVFHGRPERLDEVDTSEPVHTGLVDGFTLDVPRRGHDFAMRFTGWLRVDMPGEHLFALSSDDGSRLTIDGDVVVDNDGIRQNHRPRRHEGRVALAAGWHTIQLEYFQRGREATLAVEWRPPGRDLGPVPREALRATRDPVVESPPWAVDEAAALRGRELFATTGCASCHRGSGRLDVEPTPAPSLADLHLDRGCLAVNATEGGSIRAPAWHLDRAQILALRTVIAAIRSGATPARTPASELEHAIRTYACFRCHERDEAGGVDEARLEYFTANAPDLGDEGRLPPRLTGIGDKLRVEAIERILRGEGSIRPFMNTRMPYFGPIERLARLFVELDRDERPLPRVSDSLDAQREGGRGLVGTTGLSCIACHAFNTHRSTGIQSTDLILVTERLNADWFHRYLRSPARYRPGTRMPDFWPEGHAVLRGVLDGDTDRQISAIWSYLADGRKAVFPEGLAQTQTELIVGGEAIVYRGKMRDAGWRAIAVGHPEQVNLAFDAQDVRWALLWKGRFLDVTAHWRVQGMGRIGPRGHSVVRLPPGPELATLDDAQSPWPSTAGREGGLRFRGYWLDDLKRPTFLYSIHAVDIEDGSRGIERDDGTLALERTLELSGTPPRGGLWMRLGSGRTVRQTGGSTWQVDERLTIHVGGDVAEPVIRKPGDAEELVALLRFGEEPSIATLVYEWEQ